MFVYLIKLHVNFLGKSIVEIFLARKCQGKFILIKLEDERGKKIIEYLAIDKRSEKQYSKRKKKVRQKDRKIEGLKFLFF